MNFYSTLRRCMILLLLNFSIQRCPLLPACCTLFKELGNVTVEPAPVFLLGSSLTVSCHVKTCQWGFKITLELNGEAVKDSKEVNCNTAIFHLPTVRVPLSIVICKLKGGRITKIVNGLDLHGGFPPDKPANIVCETSRSSAFIDCSWSSATETHISTTYNISVNRENGTLIYLDQIKDAKAIKIPQGTVDENTNYQLIITAYNQLGAAQSDPFILCVKDTVIPDTPRVSRIEFVTSPIAAVLQWETTNPSVNLTPHIRLRTINGSWETRNETELGKASMRVDDLSPLTEYEFQVRTCNVTSRPTSCVPATDFSTASTSGKKTLCSQWSPTVTRRSPGKGPSQQLQAWRTLHSRQMVTVLWKPLPPEDYSGDVLQYNIFQSNDHKEELSCPATLNHCQVQVPAELQALSISVDTSYGSSPPADVPLRRSGESGPVLRQLAPAANGSHMLVSWSWPESTSGGGLLLHYLVVEWISVPATELQWQHVDKDQNHTFITDLTAGVRYNVSVCAVTTRGVSESSSISAYSKEQKPASGPNLLVLNHGARQIQIQWDKLPVHQQRGFITHYTLYIQTLDSRNEAVRVTLPNSGPRRMSVDCPEGALALQLTASTSAGEGPRGGRVVSQPADPAASWLTVVVLIVTLVVAVMANLMCWSCVRERVKEKCFSWTPVWLGENLPKLGNSNAIKLLQQDRREPSFISTDSDPLLSPISLVFWEERDVYPNVHVEDSQTAVETPLDTRTVSADSQLHHDGYKPQIAVLPSQGDEAIEEDVPANGDEDIHSTIFGNLLGGLLSSVEVDLSDTPLGHPLRTAGGLLQQRPPETADVLNGDLSVGRTGTETEGFFLESDTRAPADTEDTCLSQCTAETTLTGGYFPQVAAVSSTTVIHT